MSGGEDVGAEGIDRQGDEPGEQDPCNADDAGAAAGAVEDQQQVSQGGEEGEGHQQDADDGLRR